MYGRKQMKTAVNNVFVLTLLQEVLKMVSIFTHTQLSSAWKRNSHSKILGVFFTPLVNCWIQWRSFSLSTVLSETLVVKYPHRKHWEDSSQVNIQARKLKLYVFNQSSIHGNFWTASCWHLWPWCGGAPLCWNHMRRRIAGHIFQ